MENPDEIPGSAIERVENLERIVKRFRIAVAGGTITGGFGELPKDHDTLPLPDRLANIQQARSKFDLVGQNVGVAGSFNDGFTLS